MTPKQDLINVLSPEWVEWICDAIERGAPSAEIEATLRAQGDPNPAQTINALESHPIFAWAKRLLVHRERDARRAQLYVELHDQLWGERDRSLPVVDALSSADFFAHYYHSLRPVVIRGWVSEWDACTSWDPSTWIERFAGVEVEVSSGRDQVYRYDRSFAQTRATVDLGAFAQELIALTEPSNDRYLIARNHGFKRPELAQLLDDIDERPYLDPKRRAGCTALWFGPRGTITPLHHDTCNIMFAQVWGEKEFVLIPPHAQDLFDQASSMYSDLDPSLDLATSPQHPHQITLTLRAGEALFIPIGWWHAVRAQSLSVSLAMTHFIAPNQFDWYRPNAPTHSTTSS